MNEKVAGIIAALKERYPQSVCALHYEKDYELMIAVRLSAQCTDARVNLVTPALFAAYPTLEAMAQAPVEAVEEYVKTCGFFRQKANSLRPDFPGEIDLKRGADQPQQKIHSGEQQGAVKNP